MAISVVQTSLLVTGDNVTSLTSSSTDWTSNIGSGNSIIAVGYGFDNDTVGLTWTGLTWSAGGSFSEATTTILSNGNDRYRVSCFYLHGAAGSGTKPTATLTPSQAAFMNFAMLEVSGLENAAEETENSNVNTLSTTSWTAGAITTVTNDTLVVLGVIGRSINPQVHAPLAGYTEFGEQTDNSAHQAGSAAYQIFNSTQSGHDPAWTCSNSSYAATITAFKIASGAGADTCHLSTTRGWVF